MILHAAADGALAKTRCMVTQSSCRATSALAFVTHVASRATRVGTCDQIRAKYASDPHGPKKSMPATEEIVINVGGVYYYTSRQTLSHASYFSRLIDENEWYAFIDRDPKHFRVVLNWLRGCRSAQSLPRQEECISELLDEAEFYAMDDLATTLRSRLRHSVVPPPGAAIERLVGALKGR